MTPTRVAHPLQRVRDHAYLQARQRPVLDRLRRRQRAQEIAEIVGALLDRRLRAFAGADSYAGERRHCCVYLPVLSFFSSAGGEGDRRKSEDQPHAKAAARESHLEFSCFLQGLS